MIVVLYMRKRKTRTNEYDVVKYKSEEEQISTSKETLSTRKTPPVQTPVSEIGRPLLSSEASEDDGDGIPDQPEETSDTESEADAGEY